MEEIQFKYICFFALKCIVSAALLLGSLSTVYPNFMVWQSGQTTSSSEIRYEDWLAFPSLTFCNQSGFKTNNKTLLLNEFEDNTLKVKDFFIKAVDVKGNQVNYTIKPTIGLWRGRCFTFQFFGQFKQNDPTVVFHIKSTGNSLRFFIHDPGYEIWLHFEYWPQRPTLHMAGDFEGLKDVPIIKSQFKFERQCIDVESDPGYNQYGIYIR